MPCCWEFCWDLLLGLHKWWKTNGSTSSGHNSHRLFVHGNQDLSKLAPFVCISPISLFIISNNIPIPNIKHCKYTCLYGFLRQHILYKISLNPCPLGLGLLALGEKKTAIIQLSYNPLNFTYLYMVISQSPTLQGKRDWGCPAFFTTQALQSR